MNNHAVFEVAQLALRFGFTAFGGPAAHIAMYHDEIVRRRGWLSEQEFIDLLGAVNLIPGPNSTEMLMHIGYRQAGAAGMIAAGVGFITPAMLMVTAVAWGYVRFGSLPQVEALLFGIEPVIVAILIQALVGLGKHTLTGSMAWILGGAAAMLYIFGVNPLILLIAAGMIVIIWRRAVRLGPLGAILPAAIMLGNSSVPMPKVPFSLWELFLTFLKIGSVLYGSGYVLVAFLQADFVDRLGWITTRQMLDAVAVGQVTPGPVLTTATFIGYLLAGIPGAVISTIGIFLPSFLFVVASNPIIPRLRRSALAGSALDGVNYASLGLMTGVTGQLAWASLRQPMAAVIGAAALILLMRYRVNTTCLILGGAAAGLVFGAFSQGIVK